MKNNNSNKNKKSSNNSSNNNSSNKKPELKIENNSNSGNNSIKGNNSNSGNNSNKGNNGNNSNSGNNSNKGNNLNKNNQPINNTSNKNIGNRIFLYFIILLIVVNIVLIGIIIYLNFIHRKDYHKVTSNIMSGKCEDYISVLGIKRTKCIYDVKFNVPDPKNKGKTLSNLAKIEITDKNDVRDDRNSKVIHIEIDPENFDNIYVQRDKVKDNLKLILVLACLLLIMILCMIKYMKNMRT